MDIRNLNEEALRSPDGEGYLVLSRGDGYKVGLVGKVAGEGIVYSMEFIFRMVGKGEVMDSDRVQRVLVMTGALNDRGYSMTEDDGWICAEVGIGPERIEEEERILRSLLEAFGLRII